MANPGRIEKAASLADKADFDALILSHGSDLMYLTGYAGRADERFCAAVIVPGRDPLLIAHRLYEADAVRTGLKNIHLWKDGEDPYAILRGAFPPGSSLPKRIGVNGTMPARFLFGLQRVFPDAAFLDGTEAVAPLRLINLSIAFRSSGTPVPLSAENGSTPIG